MFSVMADEGSCESVCESEMTDCLQTVNMLSTCFSHQTRAQVASHPPAVAPQCALSQTVAAQSFVH